MPPFRPLVSIFAVVLFTMALLAVAQKARAETVAADAAMGGVVFVGEIRGDETAEYIVTGAAGQLLSVDLMADNGALNFNILPAGSAEALFNSATLGTVADVSLPAAGDYVVQV
ncbi:MAG: hypothetical protein RLZZ563_2261, partial [Pseudomonadota bacterium]